MLNTEVRKKEGIEHGTVTQDYIDYLITDVRVTYQVYEKLMKELREYQITIPPTRIYSAASIGKHALQQLGIEPFSKRKSNFPAEIIGNIMTSYFGGRCECKIRKTPTKVTVLDFTSMYPTVTMEMGLWDFIIADSLEHEDVTEEIKTLFEKLSLTYLQNTDNWKDFVVMVKIRPEEDVLPVRMNYKGDNGIFNVGINHLSIDSGMWFALPDVISSYLLTGKIPEIIQAVRFIPKGTQDELRKSKILGMNIDPAKDNLVQLLVQERQKIKVELAGSEMDDPDYIRLKSRAQAIKILVNSLSYGIFIELNPEDWNSYFRVYGLDNFSTEKNRYEKPGKYFHPLLGSMITAGSRLFLAMAETKLKELGGTHAYMDTDSIFVPPEYAQDIIDYFQPLNPYALDIPLLKPEKEDMWFYGISSKRYALYNYDNGNIKFMEGERSYKLHGLGHLSNPFPNSVVDWHSEIWLDILKLHYNQISVEDIEAKYGNLYAISKLTVSTSNILKRFKKLNGKKPWEEQIKPFNFFTVGFHMQQDKGKPVKPLSPFSVDSQKVVHEPFIDYETGEEKQGLKYFKPLSKIILQYIEHPESKLDGTEGILERKHVHSDGVLCIGKEANNIVDQPLNVEPAQIFLEMAAVEEEILSIPQKQAESCGVDRGNFKRIKDRIKKGKLNLNTPAVKRLLARRVLR